MKIQGDEHTLPIISWQINDTCNFKCSYCYTDNLKSKPNLYKPLLFLRKLDRLCNIQLLGGEPTLLDELEYITKNLLRNNNINKIAIFSNFSKNLEYYNNFIKDPKLTFVFSYHSEYFDIDKFIKKSKQVKNNFILLFNINKKIEINFNYLKKNNIRYFINAVHNENGVFIGPKDLVFKKSDFDLYSIFEENSAINTYNIIQQQKNKFKGCKCKPNFINISVGGDIENICFKNKVFINETEICPFERCECCELLEYPKYK